ncbi:16S rRNA (cytosine(1402)-N(4))-methyltransferase RsmH [Patescibacteria group bacterium]|nr:16S rRNA (cytosine(1402)-N(4))-methyltransferase RsmH [Patescibacteria group bacterium]MBU4162101.1 16S rRNA (cytosine(1402)-N(4))-methyltransferase RsmH [Patescibacteria group bacterium]
MHTPVLTKEIIEWLDPKPGENFIDCTFGEGGHSFALLDVIGSNGKVLGIEVDPELYKKFQQEGEIQNPSVIRSHSVADEKSKIQNRLLLVNDSYTNLKNIIAERNFGPVNGIVMDLGLSSWHFAESGRGFSFREDETLDMRYNPQTNSLTALEIINSYTEEDIEKILKEYGEERFAKIIARKIAEKRKEKPIRTTFDLVEVVWSALPSRFQRKKLHPATKTFQALRIAVNSEIENIKKGLVQAAEVLAKDGRIAVISFHSLEDGEVKRFFKRCQEINIFEIITKKPIIPGLDEISINPRSRSAKLRIAKKII